MSDHNVGVQERAQRRPSRAVRSRPAANVIPRRSALIGWNRNGAARRSGREAARVHLASGGRGCRRRRQRSRGRPGRHRGRSEERRRHRSNECRWSVGTRARAAGNQTRRMVHEQTGTGVLPATRYSVESFVPSQAGRVMSIPINEHFVSVREDPGGGVGVMSCATFAGPRGRRRAKRPDRIG